MTTERGNAADSAPPHGPTWEQLTVDLLLAEPEPEAWSPPPTTRWALVTDGPAAAYLLSEQGDPDDAPCPLPPPDRGNYLSSNPDDHPPAWLSPFALGTSTSHGDGIAGFAWYLTMECDRSRAQARAARRRKGS